LCTAFVKTGNGDVMSKPQITNRPGPDCDLTIRIKFNSVERFRADYRKWLDKGRYFIKTKRSKPLGTRIQLIFVMEDMKDLEIWCWGTITNIFSPEEAAKQGGDAGLEMKVMDLTKKRRAQIEALFSTDEAVEAIRRRAQSKSPDDTGASYTQVARSARQELVERIQDMIRLSDTADHYVLLGVAKDANRDQISDAFRQRSKEYHPDQYFRKIPEDMQKGLQEVFEKLTHAYRTLSNPERRLNYDIAINNYTNPEARRQAMPHIKRQKKFNQMYKKMVNPRNEKVEQLYKAAREDMDNARYKSALNNLNLAKAMDPLNRKIRKAIKEVKGMIPSVESAEK